MRRWVELVSTGSELLSGRSINRHAQTLGDRLAPLGLELSRDTTVPDDLQTIHDAVRDALARVDIVVVSGGLGPTSDDVTRDAMARLLNRRVVTDDASLAEMRRRYLALGRTLTAAGERQALIVEGADALPNAVGAAPGQRIELESQVLFVLPGPPREFLAVLEQQVIPWLAEHAAPAERLPESIFQVSGLAESQIVTRFEEAGFAPAGVEVAYCAAPARVEIRLKAPAGRNRELNEAAEKVRALLGAHIFAEGRQGIEEVIGRRLVERRQTLAVAESCTGGLLGHLITSVSGSSRYFVGGVIAYSNEVKIRALGVSVETLATAGAVSEDVARAMAAGVRERFQADYGLAVTGIAGPTGGTPDKPVGLVYIAVADRQQVRADRFQFPGDREWIKEWSCRTALHLLHRRLQDG